MLKRKQSKYRRKVLCWVTHVRAAILERGRKKVPDSLSRMFDFSW